MIEVVQALNLPHDITNDSRCPVHSVCTCVVQDTYLIWKAILQLWYESSVFEILILFSIFTPPVVQCPVEVCTHSAQNYYR